MTLRWLIRKLIDALFRPMFARWKDAVRESRPHERYEHLFFLLLHHCDCYPFCVEVDRCGLWILDEPSEPSWADFKDDKMSLL